MVVTNNCYSILDKLLPEQVEDNWREYMHLCRWEFYLSINGMHRKILLIKNLNFLSSVYKEKNKIRWKKRYTITFPIKTHHPYRAQRNEIQKADNSKQIIPLSGPTIVNPPPRRRVDRDKLPFRWTSVILTSHRGDDRASQPPTHQPPGFRTNGINGHDHPSWIWNTDSIRPLSPPPP